MRWAALFVFLASICAVTQVVRGVLVSDGVSLLCCFFLFLALISGLLSSWADKREMDRKYPR